MLLKSVNPFDLSLLAQYEEYSTETVHNILKESERSFNFWKNSSFQLRSDLFNNCSKILLEEKLALARTITLEMGKPINEAISEVEKCAVVCRYYAANGETFLQDEKVEMEDDNKEAFTSFQPLGAILGVMPWNFPLWQVFRFAVPTIMAGNVGILKHASNVPQCALAIEEIFLKSGFEKGVFQSVLVGSSKIASIIESPIVKAVSLTGSEKAGGEVAAIAGKNIKKSLLELGGSDPFIVLEDADAAAIAKMAVKARLINNGQSCIAAKRFIVHEKIYESFLDHVLNEIKNLKIGNPLDPSIQLGPMARVDLRDDLLKNIEESKRAGGEIIYGGETEKMRTGAFINPTVLSQIKPGNPAYYAELFGPVFTMFPARNEAEAIALANDTPFGLGASVWTSDLEKAKAMARKIDSGSVFINSIVASDVKLPFGGIKSSGYGRELGEIGLKEFVNVKTIHVQKKHQ